MSIWTDQAGRRHVGVMLGGRRVHRILPKNATAGAAKQLESSIRAAVGQRSPSIPGDPKLADVMGLYVTHAKTLRSPATAIAHALRCGAWVHGFRASEARQVAAAMIRDMAGHYAPATVNRSLGALKKALRLAWTHNLASADYSAHIVRLPENNQRTTYLSMDQVRTLADCASENVRAAIWIALFTGCRRGEICALAVEDIGENTLQVQAGNTKTLRRRDVPIVSALRPWLRYLPLPINAEGIKSGFGRARVKAGMPGLHFHDLRHSCATIMLASEVDLFTISKILGHASVKTTERYSHMEVKQQRAALEKAFGLHPKLHRADGYNP